MAQHPLLPFMEAHAKALNTNVKNLTVDVLNHFLDMYIIFGELSNLPLGKKMP